MRVLFVAVEAAPLAKVGGLGDVAGALPPALWREGVDVRVMIPRHGTLDPERFALRRLPQVFDVAGQAGELVRCGLWQGQLDGVPVYLIDEPRYLTRPLIYGEPDDLARFTVFCRAVLQAADILDLWPDVLHANDWHTALLPAWLGLNSSIPKSLARCASVLTIHNLAFQGWFDEEWRRRWSLVPPEAVAETGLGVSLWSALALGIRYADVITAVSPTYAQEIMTPELGAGLDPLLRHRGDRVFGVPNGIDLQRYDPMTDPSIRPHYGPASLGRKRQVKARLQGELGLPARSDLPLVGMVTRLTEQKGLDLVIPALRTLLAERSVQFVVLGTGEPIFQERLAELAGSYPERAAVILRYDEALAQRIYGGADIFLMPSRFEPCGTSQMIALRYGTVPVVRATGGLRDTVQDWDASRGSGNGFVFHAYEPGALLIALARALETFTQPRLWRRLQQTGMRQDFSWQRSARRYVELYREAIALRTGAHGEPAVP